MQGDCFFLKADSRELSLISENTRKENSVHHSKERASGLRPQLPPSLEWFSGHWHIRLNQCSLA